MNFTDNLPEEYYEEHYGGSVPDTCCPECMHDCYGEKPTRYCLECGWKELKINE